MHLLNPLLKRINHRRRHLLLDSAHHRRMQLTLKLELDPQPHRRPLPIPIPLRHQLPPRAQVLKDPLILAGEDAAKQAPGPRSFTFLALSPNLPVLRIHPELRPAARLNHPVVLVAVDFRRECLADGSVADGEECARRVPRRWVSVRDGRRGQEGEEVGVELDGGDDVEETGWWVGEAAGGGEDAVFGAAVVVVVVAGGEEGGEEGSGLPL